MNFTESQIEILAPKPTAFKEGKKLGNASYWQQFGKSERALWGIIQGSGASPYYTGVDFNELAYRCTCPSRQFPCKHALGLMVLFANNAKVVNALTSEPDWVSEWMDKRLTKPIQKEKSISEEEDSSADREKEKRLQDRIESVDAGVKELDLWLRDLIRIGLLELPSKSPGTFEKVAARMIDCKAPGLAGWVKSLGKINYAASGGWENESITIIGKLSLLIKAWNNMSNLSESWQQTIRNLIGWSQSTKELMDDSNALAIKDEWIVLGQESENTEDIIIQRTWLWGSEKGKPVLILQFATKFSPLQTSVIPGTIIEAEIAYFPGVHPLRGIIRKQRGILTKWKNTPVYDASLETIWDKHIAHAAIYPWINDQPYLINQVRIINIQKSWQLIDTENKMMPIHPSFGIEKYMQWIMITGNAPFAMAVVIRGKQVLPLGVFADQTYIVL